jgi:glycerophosphoryl diester phosphodiesterase
LLLDIADLSGQKYNPEMTLRSDSPVMKLLGNGRPLTIGHRGYRRLAPENTLPSFQLALVAGVDLVELDFRQSRDGHLMVIHDKDLDRTTDARRRWGGKHIHVATRLGSEIQSLDAGAWFHKEFAGAQVPSLGEALDIIHPRSVPLIERKAGDVETCLRLLRQKHLVNDVVVQSFDWSFLRELHELEPALTLGALGPPFILPDGRKPKRFFRGFGARWLKGIGKTGASVVVWNRRISRHSVNLAHRHRLKVWIYTVNNLKLANRLLAMGVDGIITDNPALVRKRVV